MIGGMTTGDGGGSWVIMGGGAGSRGGLGMGGQGAVAPVASWGLAASVRGNARAVDQSHPASLRVLNGHLGGRL
jgi:hypothetical protein